jgi:hypothetical protein
VISELNKIDFLTKPHHENRIIMVVTDHLDWTEHEGEHLLMLQQKLNNYLYYIESGRLAVDYPQYKDMPVSIQVAGKFPLSQEAEKFYSLAKARAAELGFSLEFVLHQGKERAEGQ